MKVTAENNTLHEVHKYAIDKHGKVVHTHLMPICATTGSTIYAPYNSTGEYDVHKCVTLGRHAQDQRSGGWEQTKVAAKKSLVDSVQGEIADLRSQLAHAEDLLTLAEGIDTEMGREG